MEESILVKYTVLIFPRVILIEIGFQSRIIWLDGVEEFNKNTKNRLIYIHGSPDEIPMGVPGSKGCIRMRNVDVIELFEQIKIFEKIHIIES